MTREVIDAAVRADLIAAMWAITGELTDPPFTAVLAGLDVATLDADGRLLRISGFFGDPPAV